MKVRRLFVLPFVLVVSCGGTKGPSPEATGSPANELAPPPEGTPTTSTEGDSRVLVYPNGDKVYVAKDGTCVAQFKEHCATEDENGAPVVSNCNPPPPQQVRCPLEAK